MPHRHIWLRIGGATFDDTDGRYFIRSQLIFGPAISNSQLSSTVTLYEQMLQSENCSICQFGSNAGGFTSYHYYKKNDKIYLIECYVQEIQRYYVVNEKWLLKQKEYLEKVE